MCEPKPLLMGEAMLRFAPLEKQCRDDQPQALLRSIAGDELNVAVALSRLGFGAGWVSVLPQGPLGDVTFNGAAATGVDMTNCIRSSDPEAEIGTFTVITETASVHYQRRNSAFARHDPGIFDWNELTCPKKCSWLHITGITPLISPNCAETWTRAAQAAVAKGVNMSLDFNHRKQLGTLEQLWNIISPFISKFYVAIFSSVSLRELAIKEGLESPSPATPLDDESWVRVMISLRKKWGLPRIACCFKVRAADGLQRRWSGRGYDRHLLGMRLLISDGIVNMKMPQIYLDPSYKMATSNTLSTSQVNPKGVSDGFGFGPVEADGLGIGYMLSPHSLTFCVTSWKTGGRSTGEYMSLLFETLNNFKTMLHPH